MAWLTKYLLSAFNYLHGVIAVVFPNKNISYGLAIIAFTAIIRVLLLPLTIKQTKSQVKMQEIQPKIKELQTKYKNDPQKLQQETMKMYKENDASPFAGCLPLIIQMPILFALFAMFNGLTEIKGVSFLWIRDLFLPDRPFPSLPWLSILPLLSGATTYLSSKMMAPPANSDQAKQTTSMNTMMAVVLTFMSYNFKSGLVLYWVTQNLFQMGQTYVMKKLEVGKKA